MLSTDRQQTVLNLLKSLQGIDPLKTLFWRELNYTRVNTQLSRRGWTEVEVQTVADDPVLFASAGTDEAFHVIYVRLASDRLLQTHERPVVTRLLRDHPFSLFVFSNRQQDRWHFINVKHDPNVEKRRLFRRITVGPEERLRTASERIARLDTELVGSDLSALAPFAVQQQHDEAFDVEAVTRQFFDDYKVVFNALLGDLRSQTGDQGSTPNRYGYSRLTSTLGTSSVRETQSRG